MLFYIVLRGLPQISRDFLFSQPSTLRGTYGILPGMINTVYIIAITLMIAAPVGIGAAVYLCEYAGASRRFAKVVRVIDFTIETLAGIPSVVYGLFGAVFFGETLKLGYSILTGALTLSLMVLPVIIRTSQEALRAVPQSYREGALGCGAGKWVMIRTVVLPNAKNGLAAAILLAVGRITGESAALLFTAGAALRLPENWLTHPLVSGASLTVQMYFGVSSGRYIDEAFGVAFVLACILLGVYLLSDWMSQYFTRKKG